MPLDFLAGEILLIDKPYRWTSFDAVNKIKILIRKKIAETIPDRKERPNFKVGHAGTLDPLATGLLIVCTGKQTKNLDAYQAQEKEYTGTLLLGATTPCFDLEKEIDAHYPFEHITEAQIHTVAQSFTGNQEQVPPLFSALKIGGKRAYKIARAGKDVRMEARQIQIPVFEITAIRLPEVDFRLVCSKGTYVRSLARDFGVSLGSGAHLIALRRTRIGNYSIDKALSMDAFEALCSSYGAMSTKAAGNKQ
jgi:tRNA pseudouridine55 synthase